MNKGKKVQKNLIVLLIVTNVVGVFLLENIRSAMKSYIGAVWASGNLLLVSIYIFFALYEIYIKYDYYSMRSYISDLSIKTCRDYIQHKNIYDTLQYTLKEVEENRFIITFPFQIVRGHSYVSQVVNCAEYQVNLYEFEAGTEITCMFVWNGWLKKAMLPWYIDRFIEKKFNASRRENPYVANWGEEEW